MRIDGIVTCVGQKYASILHESLHIWVDTLDSLTIVTDGSTAFRPPRGTRFYWTDLFTEHGAFFNKGAALASAYAHIEPNDWVLHFDADIIPPKNWRSVTERIINPGFLYGCARCDASGRPIVDPPPFPYGFFHLWNVRDPKSWVRPLWDLFWPSAGHYEISFLERWPPLTRVRLPFMVTHPCEPRTGWFGESEAGRARMEEDTRVGHHVARIRKTFTLKIPDFKSRLCFTAKDASTALEVLRRNSTTDPFQTYIRVVD